MNIRTITVSLTVTLVTSILFACQLDCPQHARDALAVAAAEWDRALPDAGLELRSTGTESHQGGPLVVWPEGVAEELVERARVRDRQGLWWAHGAPSLASVAWE